ncbi:hypothetical protein RI129_010265 [Pyrocoelia pectoralis]|uniref:Uncharacterized protein n=1 Tax=Pyrocoelia pectoralis TaxID=417401 RepID=A0AAN7VA21_9COLE
MNYEGQVTAVNTTTWVLELDHKLPIYMGLMASQNHEILVPEIGEYVKIYNAHYIINKALSLEALFVCKRSKITCNYFKTCTFSDDFLDLINKYELGCADIKAVVENLEMIKTGIKKFTQNTAEEIMWNIIDCIASSKSNKKSDHTCTNTVLAPFTLRTISNYRFVDSHLDKSKKMPVWFFGSHSKIEESDKLIGYLKVNKRYGIVLLHDVDHSILCVITNKSNLDLYRFINCLVVINSFRIFTETFKEAHVPNIEYILFDASEMVTLDKVNSNHVDTLKDILLLREAPENIPYVYVFKFKLLKKGMVNVNKSGQIECWLEVFLTNQNEHIYLGLNAHQVQIVPFLLINETYEVYHSEELITETNIELVRLKMLDVKKFQEKMAVFVQVSLVGVTSSSLSVTETIEKIKCSTTDLISFEGTLRSKSLVPSLSSRTKPLRTALKEFGTPGKCFCTMNFPMRNLPTGSSTHALTFEENELQLVLYLNNWESLQMPCGLIPGMRMCVTNVLPQSKKYLKSTALTAFQILNYEPTVLFDTVNLCKDIQICDKYSYLGWGNLIPTSILVWARSSSIYIRSLKIVSRCEDGCSCISDNCIEVTITLYAHDEMGAALVISKSLELLRLLIGLEPGQWKTWCTAFKTVKKYIYNNLQTINLFQISNLDLKCRKIDSNEHDDNDGMPLWFCVDARRRNS